MLVLTSLFCVAAHAVSAQNRSVTGRVTGPDGMPVVGATVIATDGQHKNVPLSGTTTDIDGRYSLNIPAGATTLDVQFIGYEPQTATIGGGEKRL